LRLELRVKAGLQAVASTSPAYSLNSAAQERLEYRTFLRGRG
jgi:hypothetical protein